MRRRLFFQSVILCLLLAGVLPGVALAGDPLPADHPFVQESIRAGTSAAGARIRSTAGPTAPVVSGGQIGGAPPAQGTVAAGSAEGFVAYSIDNPAMEILLPPDWELDENSSEGLFGLTIPGEFAFSAFNSFGEDSFPGLLGLAIFRSQAQTLVEQIDSSIAMQSVDTFPTLQGYPVVRIIFGGDMDGLDVTGVFYLMTGASDIYALMLITTDNAWSEYADTLDIVVQNIHFAPQTGELIQAGDEPLDFTTVNGSIGLTLPARWMLQETTDPDISFVVADEGMAVAVAVAAAPPDGIEQEEIAVLHEQLASAAEETDPAALETIAAQMFQVMDLSIDSDEFSLDQSLTQIFPGESPTIVFGGIGDFDDFVMPVFFFLNLRQDTLGLGLVLGEAADVEEYSETIISLLQGLSLPE